ncbi:translin-associated factor X-interacting protein 1-like [Cydia strobilella]|uniref:translin-associated factor X-interacting protein 1-like n=1 Tax=Cydia strobilella TaxID=1100964 RepID=UPI003003DB5B
MADASSKIKVLDGGFSSQLSCHVGDNVDGDPLWTARFLKTRPRDVYKTHLDFLKAGADIIMTNTYQASVGGFVKYLGMSPEAGLNLIKSAVELAKEARKVYLEEYANNNTSNQNPLIAGSVGPYGAHLHDGSEYNGAYADTTSSETMRDWHRPRIEALIDSGVDLLAFETVPCEKEAVMLVELLKDYPETKAWLSFSCKDEKHVSHGENYQTVARKCYDLNPEQIIAVGVNCTAPANIVQLLEGINDKRVVPIPLIVYPNSGEKYHKDLGWTEGDKLQRLNHYVHKWLDLGVKYVGGCCRTYAEDIKSIHKQRVFGISARKAARDEKMKVLQKETEDLRAENQELTRQVSKLKKEIGKIKDEHFSEYLSLARERDARYTLYFENLSLQLRLRELESAPADTAYEDPVMLRIALDRCREQLSSTQHKLHKMAEQYALTVPQREFDSLETKWSELDKRAGELQAELGALQDKYKKVLASKKSVEEELAECKERCSELERAGTPRPRWEICADFISGGRERWWQLASGLSSRDILRVLLKELGPAAESDHLEYFDGLGTDPAIPPYLRYTGKVRNIRLSRREVSVLITDVWRGKGRQAISMQEYLTKYLEDRYQQVSVRAEWAYNLCAGAEQMLDEPQVKLFWGVLHGHLSEDIYWSLRAQWETLRDQLYRVSKDRETISIEEFEKVAKAQFPLKSDVDIRNLCDVVRKQLKLKLNNTEVNLDKLFQENEEGFDRVEFARELYRQRQQAQDKYLREVLAELGGKGQGSKVISVDALKRAFAIVDPAIDHIRMERNIRWAFSDQVSELSSISPLPLRTLAARLAAGDIERVGPRSRSTHRRITYK